MNNGVAAECQASASAACLDVVYNVAAPHAGHDKAVSAIAQHPTSPGVAASCGEDRVVRIWSLGDGICRRTIPCRSKPLCVAFSRDGNFVVSSHFDGTLHAFDAGTGAEVQHIDKLHLRECVAVVPTHEPFKMVSVGRDDVLCVSDIYNAKVSRC